MRLENDGTWTFILSDSEKDAVFIITHHNHLAFRYKNKMHIIRSYRSSMYTTSSGAYRILIVPI
jgi:hypothetical protein